MLVSISALVAPERASLLVRVTALLQSDAQGESGSGDDYQYND